MVLVTLALNENVVGVSIQVHDSHVKHRDLVNFIG